MITPSPTLRSIIAGLFILCCASCGSDNGTEPPPPGSSWGWENPPFHDVTLHGVGGGDEFDLWAVGSDGTILHHVSFDDWQRADSPVTTDLYAAVGFSRSEAYAVGAAATILGYDGNAWTVTAGPGTGDLRDLWGSSGSNMIAVGDAGVTVNDGTGWTDAGVTAASPLRSVWGLPYTGSVLDEAFAVGVSGRVVHYSGGAWQDVTPFTSADLNGVWADKPGDWFFAGTGGEIWHYDGADYTPMNSGVTADLHAVFGSDSAYVFAIGDTDSILFYDDISWEPIVPAPGERLHGGWATVCDLPISPSGRRAHAIHCSNAYVVGAEGAAGNYSLLGTFDTESALTYENLNAVHATASGVLTAVGDNGVILRDDGTGWTQTGGVAADLYGVWEAPSGGVFVVGSAESVYQSNGNGPWVSLHSNFLRGSLRAVWGSAADDVYAAGDQGVILHFDGNSPFGDVIAPAADYRGVWGAGSTDVWAVGSGGVAAHSTGGDFASVSTPVSATLNAVWGSGPLDVFAAGDGGAIIHYDGADWSEVTSPAADDILALGGAGPGDAVAATASGALLRYDGASWSVMDTPAGRPLRGVARSGDPIFVVGERGAILRYGP